MSQNSTFFSNEINPVINCKPTPDVAVYYDGSTNAVPVLSATGLIQFPGAIANRPAAGIGATGPSAVFSVPYSSIFDGGAGVKLRCVVAPSKQKLRMTATAGNAGTGNLSMRLTPIQTCENPLEYDMENPIFVYYRAGVVDSAAQKVTALAARFNKQYAHLGVATVSGDFIDIEALAPGVKFNIKVTGALSEPVEVTPAFGGTYTPDYIPDWFPGTAAPSGSGINGVELFTKKDIPGFTAGAVTSNPSVDTKGLETIEQTVTVVFAANTNGNAALAALKVILRGPASGNVAQPYLAKLVGDDCADVLQYSYRSTKTDAGDAAALAAFRTAYPAAISVWRVDYTNGVSTYKFTTASASLETAANGFTIVQGG